MSTAGYCPKCYTEDQAESVPGAMVDIDRECCKICRKCGGQMKKHISLFRKTLTCPHCGKHYLSEYEGFDPGITWKEAQG